MSVRFQDGAALEADYEQFGPKPSAFPLSITCWLYFGGDDRPEPNDTWTLWWFGEVGAAGDNSLALQARRGTTGIRIAADRRSSVA